MKNLTARLERLTAALGALPQPGVFNVVQAVPVDRAGGRPPGLYPAGPPGSRAGVLVYDPAAGRPEVPAGKLAPWGLLVVSEGATFDSVL